MRILHTSDWHIGRTFHGHSTLDHLRQVLEAMVHLVRERGVDVVAVAGDIFDSSTPAAEHFTVLEETLGKIRAAGASVVITSGNHDSATRLGFQSQWAGLAGIHIVTRHDQVSQPVTIADADGPVHFYGIPFLEPSLVRRHYPEAKLHSHADVLAHAMHRIRRDSKVSGARSVVLSHCFAVNVGARPEEAGTAEAGTAEASDVERDITAGGLDYVATATFDGPDYVALGHIHGRTTLTDRVRYSGAPLHYSFSEAGKPRGVWLVELDAHGLAGVDWAELPVPRRLNVLTGTIESLLTDERYAEYEEDWVSAILTDQVRPLDGMRRLQKRFPFCATLEHKPTIVAEPTTTTYADRIKGAASDHEIVAGFLEHVRNGVGPSEFERTHISTAIEDQLAYEASA